MNKEILKHEFSNDFVEKMMNRMIMSFYKYGPVAKGYPENVDAIACLHMRLEKYASTGNTEFLVDAANFAMIEFMHPRHPDAFFEATDSSQSPGRMDKWGDETQASNKDIALPPSPEEN